MSICSRSQTNHCIAQPTFVNINGPGLAIDSTTCHASCHVMHSVFAYHKHRDHRAQRMTHDQAEWWFSRVQSSESLFPTRHLHFATQFRQSASASRNTSPTAHLDRVHAGDTFITLHNTSSQTLKPHNPTLKCERA